MIEILESTSFGALDALGQKTVRQLYDKVYLGMRPLKLEVHDVFKHRQMLTTSLDFFRKKLTNTNPSCFIFFDHIQRESLHQDLLFTFYLLSAQFQLLAKINPEDRANRQDLLRGMAEDIQQCSLYIQELRTAAHKKTPESTLFDAKSYLISYLEPKNNDELFIYEGMLTGFKHDAAYYNRLRSQWSRAGGLLRTILAQLPNPHLTKEQIDLKCITPSYVTSHMAWGLYFINVFIDISLILRHTLPGPWMGKEEEQLPLSIQERFTAQWDYRKFDLISNFNWAIAFLLSCFWLTGSGLTGYFGRILTMAFLVGDGFLAVWKLNHERELYDHSLKKYELNIQHLSESLTLEEDASQIERIQLQLDTAMSAKEHLHFEWKYQHLRLKNEVAYAWALVFAFGLIYCFLMPEVIIPSALALTIGAAGTALYFLENLAYATVGGDLHVLKSRELSANIEKKCRNLLFQFHLSTVNQSVELDEPQRKKHFVEMKQLFLSLEVQKQLSDYYMLQLIRTLTVDTITPSVLFVGYIFLSIEACLLLTALLLTVAVVSKMLLSAPAKAKTYIFDENEYLQFSALHDPDMEDLSGKTNALKLKQHGFFSSQASSQPFQDSLVDIKFPK